MNRMDLVFGQGNLIVVENKRRTGDCGDTTRVYRYSEEIVTIIYTFAASLQVENSS